VSINSPWLRYFVFAHSGTPRGGLGDYVSSHALADVARKHVEGLGVPWAQVAQLSCGRLVLVGEYQDGRWLTWEAGREAAA